MIRTVPALALALIVSLAGRALAQDCLTGPRPVGWLVTPGVASDVVVDGSHAYVADGAGGLLVVDLTVPDDPQIVGTWNVFPGGVSHHLIAAGSLVYCAIRDSALAVVDVSVPTSPVARDTLSLPGTFHGLALSGGILYAAGVDQAVYLVDVSNPDTLTLGTAVATTGSVWDVKVSGDRLYVSENGQQLSIYGISTPASPAYLGATPLSAYSLAVSGNLAYLTGGGNLTVVDASDPSSPAVVGQTPVENDALGLTVAGGRAFVTGGAFTSLQIFDLTVPAAPTLAARVPGRSVFWFAVAVAGDHAYVAGSNGNVGTQLDGIEVVDLAGVAVPSPIGTWVAPGFGPDDVVDLAVQGNLALAIHREHGLIAGGGTADVIDLTDPQNPDSVAALPHASPITKAVLAGTRAYATSGDTTLLVVDLTQPDSPQLIGSLALPGSGYALAVADTVAYVATSDGLYAIGVSDPANPGLLGSYDEAWTSGTTPHDVQVSGGLAVVTNPQSVIVLDVSDPADPMWLSETAYYPGHQVMDPEATLVGSTLYLPPQEIFDLSDPSAPAPVSTPGLLYANPGGVAGNHLYLADLGAGCILTMDVTNPLAPVLSSATLGPRYPYRLRVSSDRVIVAGGQDGLLIYGDPCAPTPVRLTYLAAVRDGGAARIDWEIASGDVVSFLVYREEPGSTARTRLTPSPLLGTDRFSYRDSDPPAGTTRYWLEELGRDGSSRWFGPAVLDAAGAVEALRVLPPSPTPFADRVQVTFQNPRPGRVRVRVLDVTGRLVAVVLDRPLPAGEHRVEWDGTDGRGRRVPAGIYFARVDAGGESAARKLVRTD